MSSIPDGGIWTEGIPMPEAKTNFGCVEVSGKIYCIGGGKNSWRSAFLNTVNVFDIETGSWSYGTEMPTARSIPACAAIGNKIYCIGGHNGAQLSVVEIYDTDTNSWYSGQPVPRVLYNYYPVSWNDKIYLICGTANNANFSDVWIYDPAADSWDTGEPHPIADISPTSIGVDDRFYCMGGATYSGSIFYDTLYIYDPINRKWTNGANMLHGAIGSTVCASGKKIYCVGGCAANAGGGNVFDYMQIYDIDADSWKYGAPILDPRFGTNGIIYQNKMYCIGGDDNAGTGTGQVDVYTFAYAVTVRYQDTEGNRLEPETVEVVEPGDRFAASAPVIAGYSCVGFTVDGGQRQNGAKATLDEVLTDCAITFIYQKDDGIPGTTDPGTTNPDSCHRCCRCGPTVHIHGEGISVKNLHVHCCGKDACAEMNARK